MKKYILLFLLFPMIAHASDFVSVDEAKVGSRVLGWSYVFNFKTSSVSLSTPTKIFIRNCGAYVTGNFKEDSQEIQKLAGICYFDESSARTHAQSIADDDEKARTARGQSSTVIETKRLIKKGTGQ